MKKIEKLDITAETLKREKVLKTPGLHIISQSWDVIEDKINEVIDKVNELDTVGKSDIKVIEHDSQETR